MPGLEGMMGSEDFEGGGGEEEAGVGNRGNISGVNAESSETGDKAGEERGGYGSNAGSADIVGRLLFDCEDREILHVMIKRRVISMVLMGFKEAIK